MTCPQLFTAYEVATSTTSTPVQDVWAPARPLKRRLVNRFVLAWRVLIGQYDALDWNHLIDYHAAYPMYPMYPKQPNCSDSK